MFRVRYDDAGREGRLERAMHRLNCIAKDGQLTAVWVSNRGNPALLLDTDPRQEAILVEGLTNDLPHARVKRETVSHVLEQLPHRLHLRPKAGLDRAFPDLMTDLPSTTVTVLTWDRGKLKGIQVATRETLGTIRKVVGEGFRVFPFPFPLPGQELLPDRLFRLPPARDYPTLASRNVQEQSFSQSHNSGYLLGSDPTGDAVKLPMPMRAVWVGSGGRVDSVASWMTSRHSERVLVLDASGLTKGWQDIAQAEVFVAWATPGRSSHINPLTRLPHDADRDYADRIMEWLENLNVTDNVLGSRVVRLVRALFLLVMQRQELNPALVLSVLNSPDTVIPELDLEPLASEVLTEEELAAWQTRNWENDVALLTPAVNVLRQLFDQYPEMVLWMPPYVPAETILESPWTIFRVPTTKRKHRLYWAGMWPLLRAVFGAPDVLAMGLQMRRFGREVLALTDEGASVLVWGQSMIDAVGTHRMQDWDLVVGSDGDPQRFARALRVAAHMLAAQAEDQVLARIRGDLGSVRLHMPKTESQRVTTGWLTEGGAILPSVISLMGDREPAIRLALDLLQTRFAQSEDRLMILMGNRDLWEGLNRETDVLFIPMDKLPMLNPLHVRDAYRWTWWAQGLGLPSELVQEAFRDGISNVQEMYRFAKNSVYAGEGAAILKNVLKSQFFGENETDPRTWFDHLSTTLSVRAIACETRHPAVTRALAMTALDTNARLIVWGAPGFTEKDRKFLDTCQAVIYPERLWLNNVLVAKTTNGKVSILPHRLQPIVPRLQLGEAMLYRRGGDEYSKVVVGR